MVGQDNAIPDLVGLNAEGQPIVIAEAKFWAGLTDNQPLTYIRRLPADVPSVLLFIAPAMRFTTLWPELQQRCQAGGYPLTEPRTLGTEFVAAQLSATQTLALASWRSILGFIIGVLEAEGQTDVMSDVLQLQGLCNRMDNEAFLPLHSAELTGESATRIVQFCSIIDDVTKLAVAQNLASVKGLSTGAGAGYYGRFMRLRDHNCFLSFNAKRWARLRSTPIWLSFADANWKWRATPELRQKLSSLEIQEPTRLLLDDGHFTVPIAVPLGVERAEVVAAVFGQLLEVAGYLTKSVAPA
jgi:hypothetical protein